MKVSREELVRVLEVAAVGVDPRESVEQSNMLVFDGDELVTFNGEVLTRVENPLPDLQGAVPAADFRTVLSRLPDPVVEIYAKDGHVRIKGKRKLAAIALSEVTLPYKDVPRPGKFWTPPAEFMGTLVQAARVCGKDDAQPQATQVHVAPDAVQASDNNRIFRSEMDTGFGEAVCVPSSSILALSSLSFAKVSLAGGCVHFRRGKHRVSVRHAGADDYPDLRAALEVKGMRRVKLPGNLADVLSRAEAMHETTEEALVQITLAAGKLTLEARKDAGWYRETKDMEWEGEPLRFSVNPKFLEELLAKTRTVRIGEGRMKISSGSVTFCVGLETEDERREKEEVKELRKRGPSQWGKGKPAADEDGGDESGDE